MSLRIALALGLLAAPVFAVTATVAALPVQTDEEAARQIVNNPDPSTFTLYGLTPAPKSKKDDTVQGGRSLTVAVTGSGTPYAVGIGSPIIQDVKAGDPLVLMFYAKLVKAEPGVTTTKINAQVQVSSAPYTTIFAKEVELTPEWKLYQVTGVADKDYAKGTIGATFHVNTGKQTVALGIVVVMDKAKK